VTAIAIVHPMNLLGKELRESLDRLPRFSGDVRLLSGREDEIGTLTEVAGAASLVTRYEPEALAGVSVAFLCGAMAENRPILADLPAETTAILLSLDATVEDGQPVVAGVNDEAAGRHRVLLSPHPGVVLLASVLDALRGLSPEEAVATLIQPASIRDDAGIEELFEQTRQIVAMSGRTATPVFGAQLAFNLLPVPLAAEPVAAQLHAVLSGPQSPPAPPTVALQLLQGAVFHSLSASLYVRCRESASPQALRKMLAAHPHLEAADKPRSLGPADAAASDKILYGNVRKDEAGGGLWLWAVMDNLTRGGALNAIAIAEAVA
jgi:aspartate-semialdehyde dehydrogenase